ncbi:MAG: hypothetical protein J6Q17_09015 [Clostridia bacterium]|nr:hypothetical protein [Clostridia bacterium]
MKTKLLSLFLAAVMLLPLAAGCANSADPAEDVSGDTPGAEPAVTEEAAETELSRENTPDNLPSDLDFGGLSVPILYRGGVDEQEIYVEDLTGEIVDDAIYNRNVSVSERLNIEFQYRASGSGTAQEFPSEARSAITGGADDYAILSWAQYSTLPLCLSHLILDVSGAKYIDYDMPWWNTDYMDILQIGNDKRFFLMGDIALNSLKVTAAVFFNQAVCTDLFGEYDSLYGDVIEGVWTIDKLYDLSEKGYRDLNGNGKKDKGDLWGISATTVANTELFAYGLGLKVIGRDADGLPELIVEDERNYTVLDRLNELYWNNEGMNKSYDDNQAFNSPVVSNLFAANEILFLPLWLKTCESLRDMESGYGILPYPKLDEAQENYISLVQDTSSIFCIPVTCRQPDEIGAVIEAMCAENYRTVIPAYYDTALKTKYSRDTMSSQMIDLIHDTSMTDFAYAYNYSISSIGTVMRSVVAANGSLASTVAKSVKAVRKQLSKLVDTYLGD